MSSSSDDPPSAAEPPVSDGLLEPLADSAGAALSSPDNGLSTRPVVPLTLDQLLAKDPGSLAVDDIESCMSRASPGDRIRAAEAILDVADEVDLTVLERVLALPLASEVDAAEGDTSYGESRRRLRLAADRLEDRKAMYPLAGPSRSTARTTDMADAESEEVDLDDPWSQDEPTTPAGEADDIDLDDPWDDNASEPSDSPRIAAAQPLPPSPPDEVYSFEDAALIPLSKFLSISTLELALQLARSGQVAPLRVFRQRHGKELFPYRLDLIDAFPAWIGPGELGDADILPRCKISKGEQEWTSAAESSVLGSTGKALEADRPGRRQPAMQADEIQRWYEGRIYALDAQGSVDAQVAWVRQATLRGVTGLDAIGEDLSLLSRLIYDASLPMEDQAIWTLSYWQEVDSKVIVQAYLRGADAGNIVNRVQTMVLPYLHVLASRAERAGRNDKEIVARHLVDALLLLPLDLVLPIFEQSKATLLKGERIIQDDLVVARLALALLYGTDAAASTTSASQTKADWTTRSAIFECLPVWDISGRDPEDDAELTATTLDSIAAFVRPSPTQPRPPRPQDLMMFFAPLPFASLSRALDILDVHLESGEILARWDTPVEMRFLLQSARDAKEQMDLLQRMVKRASEQRVGVKGKREEDERWDKLWKDLLRLNGSGDQLLRGAFGMVDGADIMRVYMGGILRCGNFDTARKMISKLKVNHDLSNDTLEKVILETSRELYDAAASGNLHTGDMKLAYDSLALAPQTVEIRRERDFIEATSRLVTFSPANSAINRKALLPREIRAHPNKLELIGHVLATSSDVYKHEQMLIELAGKLGLVGEVAKGRLYALLAEAAAGKKDWDMAVDYTEKGLGIIKAIDQRRGRQGSRGGASAEHRRAEPSDEAVLRAAICAAAMRVGGSSADEWADVERKLALLGRTAEICSSDLLLKVLDRWAEVEGGRIKLDEAAKRRRIEGVPVPTLKQAHADLQAPPSSAVNGLFGSLRSVAQHAIHPEIQTGEEDRVLGSRRAARAARMAYGLGGMLGSQLPLARSASPASAVAAASQTVAGAANMFGLRRGSGARGSSGSLRSLRDSHAGGTGDRPATPTSANANRTSGEYGRALDGLAMAGGRDEVGLGLEDVERVRRGARRALVSGVGWLLGAEEGEI